MQHQDHEKDLRGIDMENHERLLLYGSQSIAKTFNEILKFNPYHDRLGRFTTGGGFMSSGYIGDPNKRAVTFFRKPGHKSRCDGDC